MRIVWRVHCACGIGYLGKRGGSQCGACSTVEGVGWVSVE